MIEYIEFLPEQPGPYPLGRAIIEHDERSRGYAIRPVLGQLARNRPWWRNTVFDQNGHSKCTIEGTTGCLVTAPFRFDRHVKAQFPRIYDPGFRYDAYRLAQRLDAWQGEEPDYFGTSTVAAFKACKGLGLVPDGWQFRWAFGVDDVIDTLSTYAPMVFACTWDEAFDHPDRRGRIKRGGDSRGGHLTQLVWYDEDDDEVIGVNSWSRRWGLNGRFRMKRALLAEKLEEHGEAATWVPTSAVA